MSPSSGKGRRPEPICVRLSVHLTKVIFLLNQYALHLWQQQQQTLVQWRLRKMADSTEGCHGVSLINLPVGSALYDVSSRRTKAQPRVHRERVPFSPRGCHSPEKDIDSLSLPFGMWRCDHLMNPGLLVVFWKPALDKKSHSKVCTPLPVLC